MRLQRIEIKNFKSVKEADLQLNQINILIGQNGAGKSNFIQFMSLMNMIIKKNLKNYVASRGGTDAFLHNGKKGSMTLSGSLYFSPNHYEFTLAPDSNDNFYFQSEKTGYYNSVIDIANGGHETNLWELISKNNEVARYILKALSSWVVYHFHDTGFSSPLKGSSKIDDNKFLRADGSNLPSFLYLLKEKHFGRYEKIEEAVRLVAPFFDRFDLAPQNLSPENIRLEWKQKNSDQYFNAHHLSDGTLRFICLATLLLQPEPPAAIIIDEPELGLHPFALAVLAELIKSAAEKGTQIICSTQSVTFINQFSTEDIIVVDRNNGESLFNRLNEEDLKEWLEDYAVGELWEKNLIGGRP